MENEFIPYEQALELKELEFNENCLARFDGGGFRMLPVYDPLKNNEVKESWFCVTPLYQQAFRWFREKYGIYIKIDLAKSCGYGLNEAFYYNIKIPIDQIRFDEITNIRNDKEELFQDWINKKANKTYEEAELKCLKKLIEIVKNKL